jgi:hypothetical protein
MIAASFPRFETPAVEISRAAKALPARDRHQRLETGSVGHHADHLSVRPARFEVPFGRRHGATVANVGPEDSELHLVAVPEWILCMVRVEISGHYWPPFVSSDPDEPVPQHQYARPALDYSGGRSRDQGLPGANASNATSRARGITKVVDIRRCLLTGDEQGQPAHGGQVGNGLV